MVLEVLGRKREGVTRGREEKIKEKGVVEVEVEVEGKQR